MRKTTLLLGAGLGFILGSRAGHRPYQQIEGMVRKVTHHPDVQARLGQLADTARGQASAVAGKVAPSRVAPPSSAPQTYADPQDLQFSTAAARKEEVVDELLQEGVPAAELEHREAEFRQSGGLAEPRAGNKPDGE